MADDAATGPRAVPARSGHERGTTPQCTLGPPWQSYALRAGTARGPFLVRVLVFALGLLLFCRGAVTCRAALQFDVFVGYDGIVPEASWFPVVCEVKNDGLPFTGTVELTSGNQNQTRRITVELPTSTLKRFVIPMFSTTAQGYTRWYVRLYDEPGRMP